MKNAFHIWGKLTNKWENIYKSELFLRPAQLGYLAAELIEFGLKALALFLVKKQLAVNLKFDRQQRIILKQLPVMGFLQRFVTMVYVQHGDERNPA